MDQNFTPSKSATNNQEAPPEGELTKTIEQYTAKVPSLGYMGLAAGSLLASVALQVFTEKKQLANFVGQWVPTFLLIGIYNKLVKLEGSDQNSSPKQDQLH